MTGNRPENRGQKQISGDQGQPKIRPQSPCAIHNAANAPNPPVLRGVQLLNPGDFGLVAIAMALVEIAEAVF